MNQQRHILATDVTGQREARWAVPDDTLWGAVAAQGIEALDLPTTQLDTQTPIAYHVFEETGGELLPAEERVADVIQRYRVEAELRVRIVPELEAARRR